jgi:hypothetical protein
MGERQLTADQLAKVHQNQLKWERLILKQLRKDPIKAGFAYQF